MSVRPRRDTTGPTLRRLAGLLLAGAVLPAHADGAPRALFELSFAQLAEIEITSVSKKPERLADAAASVFVITGDDIRRSGAASLQEALRLAPNLQVAEVSAYGYAISARGFNSSSANKLLVLIDGRSVYTPLFSGVFWDVQGVVLEDVERIEVISGPGGTLWGTNAVNGVVNITTRAARQTQGALLSAHAGQRGAGGVARYGATLDSGVSYRVYAQNTELRHTELASGAPVDDAAHQSRAGLRADWNDGASQFRLQGELYQGSQGQPQPGSISLTTSRFALGPISVSGGNLNVGWVRQLGEGAQFSAQAYLDRTERTVVPSFAETLDIADLQLQYTLAPMGAHSLVAGTELRYGKDRVVNSPYVAFLPATLEQKWSSLFVQDAIALRDDLRLTLGVRAERNDYTGVEWLPSARLAWQRRPGQLLWGAFSRAVRAPSRLDRDLYVPGKAPYVLAGGPAVRSEVARVLELGYRGQVGERLSYSMTVFRTWYDDLRTQQVAPDFRSVAFVNQMEGRSAGAELWGTWQAARAWRLSAGLTTLHEKLTLKPGSNDLQAPAGSGRDPAWQAVLRSSLDLDERNRLDLSLRHVAALAVPDVPAYTALDLRYGWTPVPGWELALGATNLAGGGHGEFAKVTTRSELGRSAYARLSWRF